MGALLCAALSLLVRETAAGLMDDNRTRCAGVGTFVEVFIPTMTPGKSDDWDAGEWLTGKIMGAKEPERFISYDEDMLTIEYTKTDASGKEVKGTILLERNSDDLRPLPAKPQSRPPMKKKQQKPAFTKQEEAMLAAINVRGAYQSTHDGTDRILWENSDREYRRRLAGQTTIDRLTRETRRSSELSSLRE